MRTAVILTFVVVTGTGGEICLTHAMKLLGEVHDFRPRAIASFRFARAARGLALDRRAADDGFVLFVSGDAVVVPGQLRDSRDVAGLRGRGVWREDFSGRAAERDALGGNSADLLWRGHGVGGRSARVAALFLRRSRVLRWAILALALGPLFYYLVGIYSAWRFFRVAHRVAAPCAACCRTEPLPRSAC